jgi:DNA-binding Lrp family transcriptional regulator
LRIPADDVSEFLSRLSPYVDEDGARNLNKISEELGIPYQTLRFRMGRLKDQGISISPVIEPSRFGLARFRASFEVSPDLADYNSFFGGLHQSAGLHFYARSLSNHDFDSEFMLPAEKEGELSKLLLALEQMGFVEKIRMRKLAWNEIIGMKTKYYDYVNRVWDIDFSRLLANPSDYRAAPGSHAAGSLERVKYDHIDLQIIKSLQIDPWTKSVDISKKLNLTDSDISYHMRNHVFSSKMISGFKFTWIGSSDSWSKHSVIPMMYFFKSITEESARHAMSVFTACPFTWNHMMTVDGEYVAELIVPVSQMSETIRYIANGLRPLKMKPTDIAYPDWFCSQNYTIPYLLHRPDAGWQFDAEFSLGYIIQMIRERSSYSVR